METGMKPKLGIVPAACAVLFLSACGSGPVPTLNPQGLIVGTWEVEGAPMKMTAEFSRDGTAQITMLGQTIRGQYTLTGEHELQWTLNGITTKSTANVTAAELELTGAASRTIKYKRK
jgi:hypothetical protein